MQFLRVCNAGERTGKEERQWDKLLKMDVHEWFCTYYILMMWSMQSHVCSYVHVRHSAYVIVWEWVLKCEGEWMWECMRYGWIRWGEEGWLYVMPGMYWFALWHNTTETHYIHTTHPYTQAHIHTHRYNTSKHMNMYGNKRCTMACSLHCVSPEFTDRTPQGKHRNNGHILMIVHNMAGSWRLLISPKYATKNRPQFCTQILSSLSDFAGMRSLLVVPNNFPIHWCKQSSHWNTWPSESCVHLLQGLTCMCPWGYRCWWTEG